MALTSRIFSIFLVFSFITTTVIIPNKSYAANNTSLGLPVPGTMVNLSPAYVPMLMKGLRVHPDNPLLFDFIMDTGNTSFHNDTPALREESQKLIKYFLATLAIPEKDLWVNLSPYEKNRIISKELGQTELGREMLAQDYMLKQITASMIYPEKEIGKKFWDKVYAEAQAKFGTTTIPVNTFNKVWILPDQANVFVRNNTAYVVNAHLKVMLEEDYLANRQAGLAVKMRAGAAAAGPAHVAASQIIRDIILPELEHEVNQGQNFSQLRQAFNSIILASWYKKNLKEALLNQTYSNKSKINGVDASDKEIAKKIYDQYLTAYKKGVFNYIKDTDLPNGKSANAQFAPRKYFSGGLDWAQTVATSPNIVSSANQAQLAPIGSVAIVEAKVDGAMSGDVADIKKDNIAALEKHIRGLTGDIGSKIRAVFIDANRVPEDGNVSAQEEQKLNMNGALSVNPKFKNNNLATVQKLEEIWPSVLEGYRRSADFRALVAQARNRLENIKVSYQLGGLPNTTFLARVTYLWLAEADAAMTAGARPDRNLENILKRMIGEMGLAQPSESQIDIYNAYRAYNPKSIVDLITDATNYARTLQQDDNIEASRIFGLLSEYHIAIDHRQRAIEQELRTILNNETVAGDLKGAEFDQLADFEEKPAYRTYQIAAEEKLLNGGYVPQFIFAGAATRLKRGPMYPLDIWDIAIEAGEVKPEDAKLRLGLGPRQLIAYRMAILKLANERGYSESKTMKVMAQQKIIVNVNGDIEEQVLKDFVQNRFYGFNPENIFFITQPTFHGYRITKDGIEYAEDSPSIPFGHGHNFMQLAQSRQGFHLNSDGSKVIVDAPVIESIPGDTIIASHRINDLTKLSATSVISIPKLAFAIYQMDLGKNIIVELVNNPNKQKGGNAVLDKKTGKAFLLETSNSKGSTALTQLLDDIGKKGAPYNAFRLMYSVTGLKQLLKKELPFNLRVKDGFYYLEAVTGDVTQFSDAKSAFFVNREEIIHDFKEQKNLTDAVSFLTHQDKEIEGYNGLSFMQADAAMTSTEFWSLIKRAKEGPGRALVNNVDLPLEITYFDPIEGKEKTGRFKFLYVDNNNEGGNTIRLRTYTTAQGGNEIITFVFEGSNSTGLDAFNKIRTAEIVPSQNAAMIVNDGTEVKLGNGTTYSFDEGNMADGAHNVGMTATEFKEWLKNTKTAIGTAVTVTHQFVGSNSKREPKEEITEHYKIVSFTQGSVLTPGSVTLGRLDRKGEITLPLDDEIISEVVIKEPATRLFTGNDLENIQQWKIPYPDGKSLSLAAALDLVIKEYDVRGFDGHGKPDLYPQQMDNVLVRWLGRALASAEFVSEFHGRTVGLKPGDTFLVAGDNGPSTDTLMKNNLIEGLRDAGINVIDLGTVISGELYSNISRLGAQGGLYITRSHVEIGTNGFKPVIGGITLYGDMLQAMKPIILSGQYRKAATRGTLENKIEVRQRAEDLYADSLRKLFGGLKGILDKTPMDIVVNVAGGSAAQQKYVDLLKELLGDHLKEVLRSQSDPLNENGGLADPSRADAVALSNPIADIVKYSKRHPERLVFNLDLDVDRVGILWNGELYLGDRMFFPIVEYMLTIYKYKNFNKTFAIDPRMSMQLTQLVEKLGGIAKVHPKGHSKVKATMDMMLKEIAEQQGFSSVEDFLSEYPEFKILQPEYSLHLFTTNERGEPGDDGLRFALLWIDIFTQIKRHHNHPEWNLQDYINNLKERKLIGDVEQLNEQRTGVPENDKKKFMTAIQAHVMDFFSQRPGKFHFEESWRTFKGSDKPFTLIDVDGVYYLRTPVGEIFWGWSNTSPKDAFGVQASNKEDLQKLTKILLALWVHTRNEINPALPQIQDGETKALRDLLGVGSSAEAEQMAVKEYPSIQSTLEALYRAQPNNANPAMASVDLDKIKKMMDLEEKIAIAEENRDQKEYDRLLNEFNSLLDGPEEVLTDAISNILNYTGEKLDIVNKLKALGIRTDGDFDTVLTEFLAFKGFVVVSSDNISASAAEQYQRKRINKFRSYMFRFAIMYGPIDRASVSQAIVNGNGGIDFNTTSKATATSGEQIKMIFDQAAVARFRAGDFSGIRIQILGVTLLPSVLPLFGMMPGQEDKKEILAKLD